MNYNFGFNNTNWKNCRWYGIQTRGLKIIGTDETTDLVNNILQCERCLKGPYCKNPTPEKIFDKFNKLLFTRKGINRQFASSSRATSKRTKNLPKVKKVDRIFSCWKLLRSCFCWWLIRLKSFHPSCSHRKGKYYFDRKTIFARIEATDFRSESFQW